MCVLVTLFDGCALSSDFEAGVCLFLFLFSLFVHRAHREEDTRYIQRYASLFDTSMYIYMSLPVGVVLESVCGCACLLCLCLVRSGFPALRHGGCDPMVNAPELKLWNILALHLRLVDACTVQAPPVKRLFIVSLHFMIQSLE